jgi:hypothetical protein
MRFNEQDNFVICFVEETQKWSLDKVTSGGGFKENKHHVSQNCLVRDDGATPRVSHLSVPVSGGRFIYELPYVRPSIYQACWLRKEPLKRGAVHMSGSNV